MKPIKGKMSIELSLEDANYINSLIERDKAKPMREYTLSASDTFAVCPHCDSVINRNFNFCGTCGQRIDTENYEL